MDDEGGYTSVATAVALLVSISLVFAVASVEWTVARSGDVQPVADACAMAGQNTVAAYYTVAQVLDACVLSMGLTGMAVMGVGLVTAAIPGAQAVSARAVGSAVGRNPLSLIVPCHRVVGADGSRTGYAGGLERKAALLRMEGVL